MPTCSRSSRAEADGPRPQSVALPTFNRESAMLEMLKISPFGAFHTAVSLVAVVAGLIALICYKAISLKNRTGQTYVLATVITCLTGFGIFHHGGFGAPHVLGVITLAVLGIAALAGSTPLFGRASPYVETLSYSMTFFFHMIPTVTEISTRFPIGAPLVTDRDGPALHAATGVLFIAFLIGAAVQARWLHALRRSPEAAASGAVHAI